MDHSGFTNDEKEILLETAKSSIMHELSHRSRMKIHLNDYAESLRQLRATFVTLNIHDQLRGCIGSIFPMNPLIQDVVKNANAAAFEDPRFLPLSQKEFSELAIHISVLNQMEEMIFTSEKDLLSQLRPNRDGLLLRENGYSSTFLPAVWESIKDESEFLSHLKLKAGLPERYWSDTIRFFRYTTEMIE